MARGGLEGVENITVLYWRRFLPLFYGPLPLTLLSDPCKFFPVSPSPRRNLVALGRSKREVPLDYAFCVYLKMVRDPPNLLIMIIIQIGTEDFKSYLLFT
jgi:hypothetical protein